jgi:hypothetical protein
MIWSVIASAPEKGREEAVSTKRKQKRVGVSKVVKLNVRLIEIRLAYFRIIYLQTLLRL